MVGDRQGDLLKAGVQKGLLEEAYRTPEISLNSHMRGGWGSGKGSKDLERLLEGSGK